MKLQPNIQFSFSRLCLFPSSVVCQNVRQSHSASLFYVFPLLILSLASLHLISIILSLHLSHPDTFSSSLLLTRACTSCRTCVDPHTLRGIPFSFLYYSSSISRVHILVKCQIFKSLVSILDTEIIMVDPMASHADFKFHPPCNQFVGLSVGSILISSHLRISLYYCFQSLRLVCSSSHELLILGISF
jgi:hypothetical protein